MRLQLSSLLLSSTDSGNWIDLSVEKPLSITYDMVTRTAVRSDSKFILVIEKVSIRGIYSLHRTASSNACTKTE